MTLAVKEALRNGYLNSIRDAIDAAATAGKIKIYNGTRPATGGAATTLLGTVLCSDPSAPDAAAGVLTFSAFTDDENAPATGIGTWARAEDGDGNFVIDCSVGKKFTLSGSTTSGSAVITGLSDTSKIDVGMTATGTGIPAGATVASIDSGTQVTLTDNATATGSVSIEFETPDADLLMNDNSIAAGGIVRITSGTITAGNA